MLECLGILQRLTTDEFHEFVCYYNLYRLCHSYLINMSSHIRCSNFELMRLICMFGIIAMHTCSFLFINPSKGMLLELDAINTVFNTGVSLFVLISGYFGIKTKAKKIFAFWIQVLFCSILSFIIVSIVNASFSLKDCIYSFLPIISNKYWFATSYLVLMILAPILNKAADYLDQSSFKKVIISCLVLFSIVPSFLYLSVPGCGKGILHFIMMYLIGCYISRYCCNVNINKKKTTVVLFILFFIIFSINYISTVLYWSYFDNHRVIFPMSRDCSLLIVVSSLLIFFIFKSCEFKSLFLNKMASYVFYMYLLESSFKKALNMYIRLEDYTNIFVFPFMLIIYVIFIMMLCAITGVVHRLAFGRIELWFWTKIEKSLTSICKWLKFDDRHF